MPQFDVETFYANPSSELSSIYYAKKSDLLTLAGKLGVLPPPNAKKNALRNFILHHYVSSGIIDSEEARQYIVQLEDKTALNKEYMKLAIQLEHEKRENLEVELEKKWKALELETQEELEKKRKAL